MSKLQQMNVWIPKVLFKETFGMKNDFIIKSATVGSNGLEVNIIGVDEDIEEMSSISENHSNIRRHNFMKSLEEFKAIINEKLEELDEGQQAVLNEGETVLTKDETETLSTITERSNGKLTVNDDGITLSGKLEVTPVTVTASVDMNKYKWDLAEDATNMVSQLLNNEWNNLADKLETGENTLVDTIYKIAKLAIGDHEKESTEKFIKRLEKNLVNYKGE